MFVTGLGWAESYVLSERQASVCRLLGLHLALTLCAVPRPPAALVMAWAINMCLQVNEFGRIDFSPWLASLTPGIFRECRRGLRI